MTIEATYFDGQVMWIFYDSQQTKLAWISDNEDGTYTVFLPSGVDGDKRMELAHHELEHLRRGDLHMKADVADLEARLG